jgi:hypothetical protein
MNTNTPKLTWLEPQRTQGSIDLPRKRFQIVAADLSPVPSFILVLTSEGRRLHVHASEVEQA